MGQKVDISKAGEVLKTKALGIGEHHDKNDGRELALSLLTAKPKLVRHLFIEIPGWGQSFVNDAAKLASGNGSQHAVEVPLMGCFAGVTNKETLARVVSTALLAGVKVHCVDHSIGTNAEHMKKRNE